MNRSIAILGAALSLAAATAFAACPECGTVTNLKTTKHEGQGSGVGMVAGGVIGGVLGHQVGSGRGNTAATVVGAGAGAYAGNEIEKNKKSYTTHDVTVKLENGTTRTFSYQSATSYKVGDKIKVVDDKLVRR
ncbi:MAG TPA: glycine zipper 2TM domain-containing protein [Usitatibacter sp.]|nr:glycine zipper 2TM domain-containing protein [Usitatibacter sp.]